VRLYFVLACNCGLAFVDMMNLSKSQIVEINGYTVICGRRVKTNSSFSAVVLPDGRKVLDEYGDVKSFCNYTNQHLNILAKKVGKELGISVPLHSHLCRHQYITMLIRKGVPLSMVKRCVGHSDIAMTERYLSLTVDDVVEAVSSVL
jgi:integrase